VTKNDRSNVQEDQHGRHIKCFSLRLDGLPASVDFIGRVLVTLFQFCRRRLGSRLYTAVLSERFFSTAFVLVSFFQRLVLSIYEG
jgi:hypothetical protein